MTEQNNTGTVPEETRENEQSRESADLAWLPDRLERAKRSAITDLVSGLGFESQEQLTALVQRAKERDEAEQTEQEKLQARIAELEATSKLAEQRGALISDVLTAELDAVPEEKRALIMGETPEQKLADLRRLKTLGLFDNQKPAAPNMNSGEGATQRKELDGASEQDREWAQRLGIPLDRYLANSRSTTNG